ncbi:MAG: CopD family protein [Legionella longbeachae]|nr:CopD family protein [Legionella longbeachae]
MHWILFLHISALLCWSGTLLYLPTLIRNISSHKKVFSVAPQNTYSEKDIPRILFTLILTPIALLTIISGTILFIQMKTIAIWLIVKLTLVSGLSICHVLNGLLILRMEKKTGKPDRFACWSLTASTLLLIIGILYLVLAKPGFK